MTLGIDHGLLNSGHATDSTLLTIGQTIFSTSCCLTGNSFFSMTLGFNNGLLNGGYATDSTLLALGQTIFGTSCCLTGNSFFSMTQCFTLGCATYGAGLGCSAGCIGPNMSITVVLVGCKSNTSGGNDLAVANQVHKIIGVYQSQGKHFAVLAGLSIVGIEVLIDQSTAILKGTAVQILATDSRLPGDLYLDGNAGVGNTAFQQLVASLLKQRLEHEGVLVCPDSVEAQNLNELIAVLGFDGQLRVLAVDQQLLLGHLQHAGIGSAVILYVAKHGGIGNGQCAAVEIQGGMLLDSENNLLGILQQTDGLTVCSCLHCIGKIGIIHTGLHDLCKSLVIVLGFCSCSAKSHCHYQHQYQNPCAKFTHRIIPFIYLKSI